MSAKQQKVGIILVRELTIALGLLALVFLGFGHQPVQAGNMLGAYANADSMVYCGSGPDSETPTEGTHCDACRLASGAAMPFSPPVAGFHCAGVLFVGTIPRRDIAFVSTHFLPCGSRGPPSA